MADQALVLMSIGVVLLIAGLALYFAMKRGIALMLTIIGGLWLLAMVIYYVYSSMGFYGSQGGLRGESAGPLVTTVLGFAVLIVGIVGAIMATRLAGRGGGR